jgi:RND family efflux transporter MFP subunit
MPETSSPASRSTLRLWLLATAILAVLGVIYGLTSRHQAFAALQERSSEAAVLNVATTHPNANEDSGYLQLPGTLEALNEASLYARSQGYLRRLHTDIGQHVKAGQLLAQIDTPELDEQLRQAEADLATSRANEELARSTAARWEQLLEQKLVARQAAEEKVADARAKRAALEAQAANVARLRQLQGFRRIVAPFDGLVTARNVDVGQLVTAAGGTTATSGSSAGALFRIASLGQLRVFVQVPQAQSAIIRPGLPARLDLPERPGEHYAAKVVRSAGAIDPQSRALRVELSVADPQGHLLPGAYAQITFNVPRTAGVTRLPVSTLIFRGQGPMVAVVTKERRIALRAVKLGRDFGTEYEVADGVGSDEDIVLNPPDSIWEGQPVQAAQPHGQPAR